MNFWDSSAIIPLLVHQEQSSSVREWFQNDTIMIVSWTTHCECFSALTRLEREEALTLSSFEQAHARLLSLARSWIVVNPIQALENETKRLLRIHPLRCADALQLASAMLVCNGDPKNVNFITFDSRLSTAASKEGFRSRN